MRKDMAKVIVERPRRNHGDSYHPYRTRDKYRSGEDFDDYVPPTPTKARSKDLNENLAPLRRWLDKQVGRPWRLVYSDLCEHVRKTNAVQAHVLQHVRVWVSTSGDTDYLYYVNQHGLMQKGQPYRRHRTVTKTANPNIIAVDSTTQYRKIDGVWYLTTWQWQVQGPRYSDSYMTIGSLRLRNRYREPDGEWRIVKVDGVDRYEVFTMLTKRALNTKEIARLPKAA